MRTGTLSYAMREMLKASPDDWQPLPDKVGPYNLTIVALRSRGLIALKRPRHYSRTHWKCKAIAARDTLRGLSK